MSKKNTRANGIKIVICVVLLVITICILMLVEKGVKTLYDKKEQKAGTETVVTEGTEALADTEEVTEADTPQIGITDAGSTDLEGNITSIKMVNTPIDGVENLSTEIYNWGSGGQTDEYNRSAGALQYNEKFGNYNAQFIDSDTPVEDKVIYLTFDEGYEFGCTPKILDTLKEKDVKAVFFLTKPFAETEPDLVNRMIAEGHELANHSVTHPSTGIPSLSLEQQYNEIQENHEYVKENYNYEMHLFRFPAGIFSEQSLAVVNNCNYKSVFWSFAYRDYDTANQPDEAEALQKVKDALAPGTIYLLHGVSQTNANILGDFIDYAKTQGYTFKQLQ